MIPRFKPSLNWREILTLFRFNSGAVEKFEQDFAEKFQAIDAVAFPYGRSAQWAFLKALSVENAEVIMPAYTCSVVAHAITLSGNKPRFIDIDLQDYNMNLDLAEAAINERTRVIIATHTFGYPQDLDRLESMVEKAEKKFGHKIWLMQDCCHAFGAEWKGRMIGTSGDVAVYAFNISKLMTSIFGGMLTFQNKDLAQKVRNWRDANFRKPSIYKSLKRKLYLIAAYMAFSEKLYGFIWWFQEKTSLLDKLTKSYHLDDKIHFPPDFKDKMLNCEAAVGLEQLKKYPNIITKRRNKAKTYDERLEKRPDWVFPPIIDGATYSHYTVRVPNRAEIINEFAEKKIQLGELIQYSVPKLKCYRNSDHCPIADSVSKQTINFPLNDKKRNYI
jgi:dTDP-4-amino-4,6-dideoxygalactose transaminase